MNLTLISLALFLALAFAANQVNSIEYNSCISFSPLKLEIHACSNPSPLFPNIVLT